MIQIDRLTKRYGATVALDDVSFEVRAGAVTGLLGPNGAGKSTLMRLIVALDRPTSGRVTIGGRDDGALRQPLRSWERTSAAAPCILTSRPASTCWPWLAATGSAPAGWTRSSS
jgi:ABC-2 type transport system ATP-binding protein